MAKAFRKMKAKNNPNLIQGTDKMHPSRYIKFNKLTLEYLVCEKETNKIITYYLPKWKNYLDNKWTIKQWLKVALNYAKKNIK